MNNQNAALVAQAGALNRSPTPRISSKASATRLGTEQQT